MKKLLWIALVACVATYLCGPVDDPDLWWHIVVGKWILSNGHVPEVDYWNTFGSALPWLAYSWSNEIVFAFVDSAFGTYGLLTLKLLLSVTLVCLIFGTLSSIARDRYFGALIGTAVAAACLFNFGLRPQSLSWLYFLGILYAADRVRDHGLTRYNGILLFSIMCLWANTHITTLLGLIALFLWLVDFGDKSSLKTATLACVIGLLGTFLTPYFGKEWIVFFGKTSHPLDFSVIKEFQPATLHQVTTGVVILLVLLLGFFIAHKPKALSIPQLLAAALFTLGGLFTVKFLPMAAILLGALLARAWASESGTKNALGNVAEGMALGIEKLKAASPALTSVAVLVLALGVLQNSVGVWKHPIRYGKLPKFAVDFIQEKNLPFPLLNVFGHGGYLMYRFSDENGKPLQTFPIDGRTNVNRRDIMSSYIRALDGHQKWPEYIEKVGAQTILWRNESPLVSILLEHNDWCSVYREDDDRIGNSVFVRREYFEANRSRLESTDCS